MVIAVVDGVDVVVEAISGGVGVELCCCCAVVVVVVVAVRGAKLFGSNFG